MFKILNRVGNHAKATVQAAQYISQGLAVTSDYMGRRPMTVQYPLGNSNAD